MIRTPTTFVLGAGASIPLGMPSSGDLKEQILNFPGGEVQQLILDHAGVIGAELQEFQTSFRLSNASTIDQFLEHNTDLRDLGKLLIAGVLLGKEHPNGVTDPNTASHPEHRNWLPYLFEHLNCQKVEEFAQNKVYFVTFNYDRTLEFALFQRLKHYYALDALKAAEALKQFEIIHLHGKLGELPELAAAADQAVKFEGVKNPSEVIRASKMIRVIHDEDISDKDPEFIRARELLHSTERLVFLGFGFADDNCNRLGLRTLSGKPVYCSTFNLTWAEMNSIKRQFNPQVSLNWEVGNYGISDYLKRWNPLS